MISDGETQKCLSVSEKGSSETYSPHQNINPKTSTLFEKFQNMKEMLKNKQDLTKILYDKETLLQRDEFNHSLMHFASSLYLSYPTEDNEKFLWNLKDAFKYHGLEFNTVNIFGLSPAAILGEADSFLAEEIFFKYK